MDESTINEWYSFYLFEYQLFISDMITLFCLELITPFFVNVFFSFSIYLLCDTLQLYQMACPDRSAQYKVSDRARFFVEEYNE